MRDWFCTVVGGEPGSVSRFRHGLVFSLDAILSWRATAFRVWRLGPSAFYSGSSRGPFRAKATVLYRCCGRSDPQFSLAHRLGGLGGRLSRVGMLAGGLSVCRSGFNCARLRISHGISSRIMPHEFAEFEYEPETEASSSRSGQPPRKGTATALPDLPASENPHLSVGRVFAVLTVLGILIGIIFLALR